MCAISRLPIPVKYMDVDMRTTASLDVSQEKNIDDNWNVDGDRFLLDPWIWSQTIHKIQQKVS